ncbi:MAG: B12-binding protein, partial [Magnetococcales bacterium]|nr:B12-binding protein [Magnetococcales bacterium]
MRFLFVYPNEQLNHTPQMGILTLGSLLMEHGIDVSVCDLTFTPPAQWYRDVDSHIARFKPDILGISVRTMKYTLARDLLREIRKNHPRVLLVAGGPQATYCPEDVAPEVDYGVIGDGEGACLDLCRLVSEGRRQEIQSLGNVYFMHNGVLVKNKPRPLFNLADTPLMRYALFDERHYRNHNFLHVVPGSQICGVFEASRGCPYQCTYCSSPTLMAMNRENGKWRREKPGAQIRREIDHFKAHFGRLDMIYFVDEVMMTSDARTRELRTHLEDMAIPFIFSERPELITQDRAHDIKAAGAYSCCIGIESGNESYRQTLLQRKMTDEKLKTGFRLMRESG